MKNKLFLPFIILILILITLTFFSLYLITSAFKQNKTDKGLELVNLNDVVKGAQDYLEGKNTKGLEAILKRDNCGLVLYDLDGNVIYKSKSIKETLNKEEINKVMAKAGNGQKTAIVSYSKDHRKYNAVALISSNRKKLEDDSLRQKSVNALLILSASIGLLLLAAFLYLNFSIVKPFRKLEFFAGEVARGNLEIPLEQGRRNFFGAFTWAFDMLRSELKISREREALAEKSKKELVAALSHDVRTPIASIRAYAECLKSIADKNSPRADKYLDVILEKTDELAKLSQNMFMHAISDLEKLEITPSEYRSRELLNGIIEPLILQYDNRIVISPAFPDVGVITDKARLTQVFENILSNTEKYSPGSDIYIKSYVSDGVLVCCLKDCGNGVPPEEITFLFDKFYRGSNAKQSGKPGSGLGLYISRYILEKTDGWIKAYNYNENGVSGFAVEVAIKVATHPPAPSLAKEGE